MRSPGVEDTFPDAVRSPLPLLILEQDINRQACGQSPSPTSPFRKWILQEAQRKERTALWSNQPVSDPGGERSEVVWLPVDFSFPHQGVKCFLTLVSRIPACNLHSLV